MYLRLIYPVTVPDQMSYENDQHILHHHMYTVAQNTDLLMVSHFLPDVTADIRKI